MHTRPLGNSDLFITPIGFGAWALGGGDWQFAWGDQDDQESIAAIHRALELGINWIDTAPVYGLGHAEEVVARALAEWKGQKPYVFTKCSMVWNEARKVGYSHKEASIRQECEDSLRRLRVEAIDLLQVHWPANSLEETLEGWGAVAKLKEEGKIRWGGISNFSLEQLEKAHAISPITSLQPPYSLIKRDIEAEILPWCADNGVGVIVYSPMASGLLTGKMTAERAAALPKNDWRGKNPEFKGAKLEKNLALVERLKAVGGRHGSSPGETAIAWTLRHPAVTAAIVGARSAAQVEGTAGGADLQLSEEETREIEG